MEVPSLIIALIAGLVSFLSPCVLPLVPAYIGYMSGSALTAARATATLNSTSATGLTATGAASGATTATLTMNTPSTTTAPSGYSAYARWIVLLHALAFVAGLTIVFVVVIGGLAGTFSFLLREKKLLLQQIMGVMLLIFGLHTVGLINIPFLNYTRRLDLRPANNLGYLRSLLIGMGFGFGWTPCVGPTLGAIFTLALNGQESQAFLPALAYSLGLGIPFLVTAMALGRVSGALKRITRHSYSLRLGSWTAIDGVNIVSLVSGALLIMMGVLVFTNSLTILTTLAPNWGV